MCFACRTCCPLLHLIPPLFSSCLVLTFNSNWTGLDCNYTPVTLLNWYSRRKVKFGRLSQILYPPGIYSRFGIASPSLSFVARSKVQGSKVHGSRSLLLTNTRSLLLSPIQNHLLVVLLTKILVHTIHDTSGDEV